MHEHSNHIRSFVLRQTRRSKAQDLAIPRLSEAFVLDYQESHICFDEIFARQAPRILEIGFGMGHASAEIAVAKPDFDFIGVEVHTPGVGALLLRIEAMQLQNIRIIQKDVFLVLQHMIPPESLDGVHIFFPDPWPKKRHHKRRLIQASFLETLARVCKPGAYVYLASDWEEYAQWMLDEFSKTNCWKNRYENFAPKQDWRPRTSFEHKGLEKQHQIRELIFEREYTIL
jgi:tRNA (guanine-N7-)-methyltransferase